jgi:hypothetical protein
MIEQTKTTEVQLCTLCEEYDDVCGHDLPYPGYRCNLCRYVHSLNSDAMKCCMDLVSKAVIDEEAHLAKEKKAPKAEDEIPVAILQGKRDK